MVRSATYPHVEAKLYQYVTNIRKSGFAVMVEILQSEGCRLARKHNISASSKSVMHWQGVLWSDTTSP
jgi:hypothetical protein